ncbi:MAG TPA: hypothetical protein VKR61_05195 [Bryobacteraceae bacterium]|nr:hypothetical protein [Bryobacteraceae bacterium]
MTGTDAPTKFATWIAPDQTFKIEYSGAVVEQIREIAVEGYHRVPHGGVETGGVLFGTHNRNGVSITAWRPVTCEYARGPSFLLSEKDEAALVEALESWGGAEDLAGLEPVGWYRSHTRSEILLLEADLAFFNRFFPHPWQVGLIVRPATFTPTRGGFFFREADGSMRTQSSYREFVISPQQAAAVSPAPPVAAASAEPAAVESVPEEAPAAAPVPEPTPPEWAPPTRIPPKEARTQRVWGKWVAAGAMVVLAAAGLGYWLLQPVDRGLSLSATDRGGELRIAWDRKAPAIGNARGAVIAIDDHGLRTEVKLTPADLRSGSVFYARQSGDVRVRMWVDLPEKPPLAETTRFLEPGAALQAAKPVTQPGAAPPAAKSAAPPARPAVPPAGPASVTGAPAVKRPVVAFRPPAAQARQSAAVALPGIAPPKIDSLPPSPQVSAVTSVLPTSAPPSAPPPPAAPSAPPRPRPSAPASGRLIWTGKLVKNGRLVVEANRASVGAISGSLPAGPVRVSAYPGELTAAGITLFTTDLRFSKPLTEAAAADNGWNATTYTWDPKRAAGVKVLAQPTAQNGYKLVLESDAAKVSVVVLEWRAPQ